MAQSVKTLALSGATAELPASLLTVTVYQNRSLCIVRTDYEVAYSV